jgi:hypothetical protein
MCADDPESGEEARINSFDSSYFVFIRVQPLTVPVPMTQYLSVLL